MKDNGILFLFTFICLFFSLSLVFLTLAAFTRAQAGQLLFHKGDKSDFHVLFMGTMSFPQCGFVLWYADNHDKSAGQKLCIQLKLLLPEHFITILEFPILNRYMQMQM